VGPAYLPCGREIAPSGLEGTPARRRKYDAGAG